MIDLDTLSVVLQIGASIATILGIPFGLLLYYQAKRRERLDREWGTYNALAEEDTRFMEACLENPELDILEWLPLKDLNDPIAMKERKEMLLFAIQLNEMERAYLLYRDQGSKIRKAQWVGWEQDMRDHCENEKFRDRWRATDWQLDEDFMGLVKRFVREQEEKEKRILEQQSNGPSRSV